MNYLLKNIIILSHIYRMLRGNYLLANKAQYTLE